ncbi:uncharacterized protein LOC129726658 [Wyeomyia smithii]|uniref:uncharacterized protein LOC129726658 n=1 Tax=Wyeomyia smithii TaxID=174621 RepID=UPI002467AC8D|nr:uncharacterized protein LOC129726658 [Wyeomyia smithii]
MVKESNTDFNRSGSTSPKSTPHPSEELVAVEPNQTGTPSCVGQTEPTGVIVGANSYQSQAKTIDNVSETNDGGIRLFKVSDYYSVEKFNRLLDKLDKGHFLIKSNFKKSYSLILTKSNSRGVNAERRSSVVSPTKDCNNDSNNNESIQVIAEVTNDKGSAVGMKRGNLIKANSSTGIYHSIGKRPESKRKLSMTHDLNSISATGKQFPSKLADIDGVSIKQAETFNKYNSKSLSLPYCNEGGKDNNNDSDEFCRSEIFDNDSIIPEGRVEFVANDQSEALEEREKSSPNRARGVENNYENIHRYSSNTVSHYSTRQIRRKSNISRSNRRQEGNNSQASLSKEEHGIVSTSSSNSNEARSKSAIPTRFFKRQDYAQPELDFPSDYSEPGCEKRTVCKRGPKLSSDLFRFPFASRKKSEKIPQLKNINLNFPNKTTGFEDQEPSHLMLVAPQWQKSERKYFTRARTQIIKLGQRCKLFGGAKVKRNRHISSYNLDDLIKATHKYEENERTSLNNKTVYKSYKSELDLTKNLTYLDTFLKETFDNEQQEPILRVATQRPARRGHKRAKSCSKTLDQMLMTAATTTTPVLMPQTTNNARTLQNLILLDETWGTGNKKVKSEQVKNNTIPSSTTASSTNKIKLASLIKMENDFNLVSANEDAFDDGRPTIGERSAKSNTTSSSLSSSDYASVYSAPSSSAGGNSSSGNKMQKLKLICTPEETLRCYQQDAVEYSSRRHSKSKVYTGTEANEGTQNLLPPLLDDSSHFSLHAANNPHPNNNPIAIENQDQELYQKDFHNASTLKLSRPTRTGESFRRSFYPDLSSRQQTASIREQRLIHKQQNNHHCHRQRHQRQHQHQRQSPLDVDLTYQEDYLEHYQNTRVAALVGLDTVLSLSCGASSTASDSNGGSSLEYYRNPSYHYTKTVIDNGSFRSNISTNEQHTDGADDDDDDDEDDTDDDDEVDDDDDINDDATVRDVGFFKAGDYCNADNNDDARVKERREITQDIVGSQDGNELGLMAARSRAHSFTNNFNHKDLLTSTRSFSRTSVKLSQAAGGNANPGFFGSYGPHRVIVSKSRKERGELVLEYEC